MKLHRDMDLGWTEKNKIAWRIRFVTNFHLRLNKDHTIQFLQRMLNGWVMRRAQLCIWDGATWHRAFQAAGQTRSCSLVTCLLVATFVPIESLALVARRGHTQPLSSVTSSMLALNVSMPSRNSMPFGPRVLGIKLNLH